MSERLLPSSSNQIQEQDNINDLNDNYSNNTDCKMKALRISLIIFAIFVIILIIILISSSLSSWYGNYTTLEYDEPESNKAIKLFYKVYTSSVSSITTENKTYNQDSFSGGYFSFRSCIVLDIFLKIVNYCFREI